MSWEAIAALAEIVGAIAVVVSLIYVSMQIRHSNTIARMDAAHRVNTQYAAVFTQLSGDGELASIYCRALKDDELKDEEVLRFKSYLVVYFGCLEDLLLDQQSGLYTVDLESEDIVKFVSPIFRRMLACQYGREWFLTDANHTLAPKLIRKIKEHSEIES